MKRVLITGKNSYIGTNFRKCLEQYPEEYHVEELDLINNYWEKFDFSSFDIVFHVAGIAHIKETKINERLYYDVNCDLALKVANKAKKSGVKNFIFMSSMSVYGVNYSQEIITKNTKCFPNTYYGLSKYQAEQMLKKIENDDFKICVLRAPMVYGDGAPGNLAKLFKIVKKIHVFPTIENQRSSITATALSVYIRKCIENDIEGICLPQNMEYMSTVETVKTEMNKEGVKVIYVSFFNPIIRILIGKVKLITKCFGDLKYEK